MYIRYFWQGNHHTHGHIRCVYTVLANPTHDITPASAAHFLLAGCAYFNCRLKNGPHTISHLLCCSFFTCRLRLFQLQAENWTTYDITPASAAFLLLAGCALFTCRLERVQRHNECVQVLKRVERHNECVLVLTQVQCHNKCVYV